MTATNSANRIYSCVSGPLMALLLTGLLLTGVPIQAAATGAPAELWIEGAQKPEVGVPFEMQFTLVLNLKSTARFNLRLTTANPVDLISDPADLSGLLYGGERKTIPIILLPKQLGDFRVGARLELSPEGGSSSFTVLNAAVLRLRSSKERSDVFVDQKLLSPSSLVERIKNTKPFLKDVPVQARNRQINFLQGFAEKRADSNYEVPSPVISRQQTYLGALKQLRLADGNFASAEQTRLKESLIGLSTVAHIGSQERKAGTDGLIQRNTPVTFIYNREFQLTAGQIYDFETRNLSPGSDTVAYLLSYDDSTGERNLVAFNDDAGENSLESRITFIPDQDGSYTLVVRSYNEETRGDCDIYLNGGFLEHTTFGGTAFRITSDVGDVLSITKLKRVPNRTDPFMFAIPGGNQSQVLWDDDGGKELGSMLALPQLNAAELVVGAYSNGSEGRCDLVLNTADGSSGDHPRGDLDGDGLSNELERALGTNPYSNDSDADGLLDPWEVFGVRGTDYAGLGANPNVPDIFVQADWMASTHNHEPNPAAVQIDKDSFDVNGITLHVDAGDPEEGGEGHLLPAPWTHLDNLTLGSTFQQIKAANFPAERVGLWHYTIFAHKQGPSNCSSGVAFINGSDFLVTLGCFSGQIGTVYDQAGTFIHELGHNLSLRHGGFQDLNYKPNYRSVMNYLFQIRGTCGTLDFRNGVVFTPCVPREFFYSYGTGIDLDENCLDETVGIGEGPIDWDMDGKFDTCVRADINYPAFGRPDGRFDLLLDYDDYSNLRIRTAGAATDLPVVEEVVTCAPPVEDPE